ncbi:hypothetical protein SO694_00061034 [Aureococcus anophagefferens]|uniref:SnoaL-like domain-containing protein n=1 Tax=Aureococcus anophagefferens TaxID=44056 RepID=A0ABR1FRG4_AURAN
MITQQRTARPRGSTHRSAHVAGLLDEDDLATLTRVHEVATSLTTRGAVEDASLFAPDCVLRSQYGDPIATGPEGVARVGEFFARVVDRASLDPPSVSDDYGNFSQPWRIAAGVASLAGESRLTVGADGAVAEVELVLETLNGVELSGDNDRAVAAARAALVGLLGGENADNYNTLADWGQRAVLSTLRSPVFERPDSETKPQKPRDGAAAAPDAAAVGAPGFDAYVVADAGARRVLATLERGAFALSPVEARRAYAADLRVSGLAGEAVVGLDESLDEVLRALALAKRSRDALAGAGGVAASDDVDLVAATFRPGDRALDVVLGFHVKPTAALSPFLASALGLGGGALDAEANVTYSFDASTGLAASLEVAAVAVNGQKLQAPALYTWASTAAAALGSPAADRRAQRRRHHGAAKPAKPEDAAAVLRAADAHHALLAEALCGDAGVDDWLDAAGVADGVSAARALLLVGPFPATCAVDAVTLERDRSVGVALTLRRRSSPDVAVRVTHTVRGGAVDAVAVASASVEGADVVPKRLAEAVKAARAANDAQSSLGALFKAFQGGS